MHCPIQSCVWLHQWNTQKQKAGDFGSSFRGPATHVSSVQRRPVTDRETQQAKLGQRQDNSKKLFFLVMLECAKLVKLRERGVQFIIRVDRHEDLVEPKRVPSHPDLTTTARRLTR